jgi:uncharacterized membrane protein YdjX (TVP38/TMEM64 family)
MSPTVAPMADAGKGRYRPLLLVVLFVGLLAVGKFTGLTDQLDAERIRQEVAAAGALGGLLFVVIFAIGELVHVPGMIFVAAAALAYGPYQGFVWALFGALVSVSLSFVVVRGVGGQALAKLEKAWIQKILAHLDRRPVLTVAALRSVLWLAPGLNYALAMTRIRFRDYLLGSSLGLVLPILGVTAFSDLILR